MKYTVDFRMSDIVDTIKRNEGLILSSLGYIQHLCVLARDNKGIAGLLSQNIIIFVLSGALLLVIIIVIIISVICCRRKHGDRLNRVPVSNSFLHIAPRQHGEVDYIRPNMSRNTSAKDWQSLNGISTPPRYATVEKGNQHWEERLPLGYPTSDQEMTEYENDGSGQVGNISQVQPPLVYNYIFPTGMIRYNYSW